MIKMSSRRYSRKRDDASETDENVDFPQTGIKSPHPSSPIYRRVPGLFPTVFLFYPPSGEEGGKGHEGHEGQSPWEDR